MATFTPPTVDEDPPVLPDGDPTQSPTAVRLFRWYRARPAGINVYMYRLGTVSEERYGRVTDKDPVTSYTDGEAISNGWEDIEIVFWGGHSASTVTAEQAQALEDAGYIVDP